MPASVLLKSSCLLLGAVFLRVSWTAPRPQTTKVAHDTFSNKYVIEILAIAKYVTWGVMMYDLFATLSVFYGHGEIAPYICPGASAVLEPHPIKLFDALTLIVSLVLWIWCLRILGQVFIFQVITQPKHKPITRGPGVYFNILGAMAVCCALGAWSTEWVTPRAGGLLSLGFLLLNWDS